MKIVSVIPTLNEGKAIGKVIEDCFEEGVSKILIVDGGSTDGTRKAAKNKGARVIVENRKGYGRAYLTGFNFVLKNWNFDLVFCLDGDGTYLPAEIERMLPLVKKGNDFIIGNRLGNRSAFKRRRYLGNLFFKFLIRVFFGLDLNDFHSGMWLIKRKILEEILSKLNQEGMPFSLEIKLIAFFKRYNIAEVPIRYGERIGKSKLSSLTDGFEHLHFLLSFLKDQENLNEGEFLKKVG